MKKKKKKKLTLRIPTAPPTKRFKDKSKYDRKEDPFKANPNNINPKEEDDA